MCVIACHGRTPCDIHPAPSSGNEQDPPQKKRYLTPFSPYPEPIRFGQGKLRKRSGHGCRSADLEVSTCRPGGRRYKSQSRTTQGPCPVCGESLAQGSLFSPAALPLRAKTRTACPQPIRFAQGQLREGAEPRALRYLKRASPENVAQGVALRSGNRRVSL